MFPGIDVASVRHWLARLDNMGKPVGKPVPITEDRDGHDKLMQALGPAPLLVALEATAHYWKNLFAILIAAGHDVTVLNPFVARRFQDASLERTKTDAINTQGLARLAFRKRPAPTRFNGSAIQALRELVGHRDRIRQDFDDRVRQLHRLVDLVFPEFTRHVQGLDVLLAISLLSAYPTAQAFARAVPGRVAKLRYDRRRPAGAELAAQLVDGAKRSFGQHHGPAYALQARYICHDLDLWRARLADSERDIAEQIDRHDVGKLITTVDGIGPQTAARMIAAAGDPAQFKSAAAFTAFVGIVPGLRQSGKRTAALADIGPLGHARLRWALWMLVFGAVRRNDCLRPFYERLRAAGKRAKLALIAATLKLLCAIYSVAKNRKPFTIATEQAREA